MVDTQVPGLKIGARTEFLVIGDVIPGHEETLRQVLREHHNNPNTLEALHEIGTLHEARFVLIDGGKRLLFASSFDGDWDKYIDDFAVTAIGHDFDVTWEHVQGYPGIKSGKAKDWFRAHAVKAGNYVCSYPKQTVQQVLRALAIQQAFDQVLENPAAAEALKNPALKPLADLAADQP